MKQKLTSAVGILLLSTSFASYAAQDGPGCGLGQVVWEGQSGLMAHISAATTNASFTNQLFGLTSGTLGCDSENAVVQNDYEKKQFVAANIDSIALDVAQGGGDHLYSLASLIGIEQQDQTMFFSLAQSNYENIFTNESNDYNSILAALDTAMLLNPQLKQYVR